MLRSVEVQIGISEWGGGGGGDVIFSEGLKGCGGIG